jgi:hypothetical protein
LLPGISVQIKLTKNKEKFFMLSKKSITSSVSIRDCFLRVRRNQVSPAVYAQHLMELEKTTAKYEAYIFYFNTKILD